MNVTKEIEYRKRFISYFKYFADFRRPIIMLIFRFSINEKEIRQLIISTSRSDDFNLPSLMVHDKFPVRFSVKIEDCYFDVTIDILFFTNHTARRVIGKFSLIFTWLIRSIIRCGNYGTREIQRKNIQVCFPRPNFFSYPR